MSQSTPILCCAFEQHESTLEHPLTAIPDGYQIECIGSEVTHNLAPQRIYFTSKPFSLNRLNLLWSYQAVTTLSPPTIDSCLRLYDDALGEAGLALGFGITQSEFKPFRSTLIVPETIEQLEDVWKTIEILYGARSPLFSRLFKQATYSVLQQTGINLEHFRFTWLMQNGLFVDLNSEKIIEQYSSTESSSSLVSRLMSANQNHRWPDAVIEEVVARLERMFQAESDRNVKLWLAGTHIQNLTRLLDQLSRSELVRIFAARLKIKVTAPTEIDVQKLKDHTREVTAIGRANFLAPTQMLWRSCVFHSRHNFVTDAPYRDMDLIVAPWIFPALKPEIADLLFNTLSASQRENSMLLIDSRELSNVKPVEYDDSDGTGFLVRRARKKASKKKINEFPRPASMDDELGTALHIRLDETSTILSVKGNAKLFCKDRLNKSADAIGENLFQIISDELHSTLEELLSHISSHKPRKKLLIGRDHIYLATVQSQIFDRRQCRYLTIEFLEDVDVHHDASSPSDLPERLHVMGQEKSRAFSALERLSVQLASDNDMLQSELEPAQKEVSRLRQVNQELEDGLEETNLLRAMYEKVSLQNNAPLAVCDGSGVLTFVNHAFVNLFGLEIGESVFDQKFGFARNEIANLVESAKKFDTFASSSFLHRETSKPYTMNVSSLWDTSELYLL